MTASDARAGVNLGTKEAAARLGVTIGTLANWRSAGVGPTYLKVGRRRVMYRLADLEAFEQAGIRRTV